MSGRLGLATLPTEVKRIICDYILQPDASAGEEIGVHEAGKKKYYMASSALRSKAIFFTCRSIYRAAQDSSFLTFPQFRSAWRSTQFCNFCRISSLAVCCNGLKPCTFRKEASRGSMPITMRESLFGTAWFIAWHHSMAVVCALSGLLCLMTCSCPSRV